MENHVKFKMEKFKFDMCNLLKLELMDENNFMLLCIFYIRKKNLLIDIKLG